MFLKKGLNAKKESSLTSKSESNYAETSSRVGSIGVKPLPLIGRWKIKNQYLAVIMVTIVALFLSIGIYLLNQQFKEQASSKREEVIVLRSHYESLIKNLQKVKNGDVSANVFNEMSEDYLDIEMTINRILSNASSSSMTNTNKEVRLIAALKKGWSNSRKGVMDIINNRDSLNTFKRSQYALLNEQPRIDNAVRSFLELAINSENGKNLRQMMVSGMFYLNKIEQVSVRFANVNDNFKDGATILKQNIANFRYYLSSLENGDTSQGIEKVSNKKARDSLFQLKTVFNNRILPIVSNLANSAPLVQSLRGSVNNISNSSSVFLNNTDSLIKSYDQEHPYERSLQFSAVFCFLVFLIGIIGVVIIYIREERIMEVESRATLSRNQQEVTQLLQELGHIRSGDLTRKVTILGEFTSTIAAAINDTVVAMSELVKGIHTSCDETGVATDKMGSFSKRALSLSEDQVKLVISTSESITRVEKNLQHLVERADEINKLADKSLSITEKGLSTIKHSISGIKEINGNVSETRDNVLGLKNTSSQISEILSAIQGIAERTNVLAVNAKLEANRAGNSGKGFKVVASSVQELAQQATEATNSIHILIESVKRGIDVAINSMNETAIKMDSTAKSSETVSNVFDEIKNTSNILASEIGVMRNKVLAQASEATKILSQMKTLVETSNETSQMNETANQSAVELASLMQKLRQSTESFKIN